MPKLDVAKMKEILTNKGINYAELAERIGVDRSSVSAWVNGKSNPSSVNLTKLAESLKMEESELIDEREGHVTITTPQNVIITNHNHHIGTIHIENLIVPLENNEAVNILKDLLKKENGNNGSN